MHAVRTGPRMAMALGLLAAAGVSACAAAPPTVTTTVTATAGQPASLAASAAPASATPASATTAAAASATSASAGEVRNLIVSASVRAALLAAYAANRSIPASDVQGVPGSVYYAYVPATGTYWAMAHYEPASGDSLTVQVGFQDGGGVGFYKQAGNGPWQVTLGGEPVICGELRFFPQAVLAAWSQPTSATPASMC